MAFLTLLLKSADPARSSSRYMSRHALSLFIAARFLRPSGLSATSAARILARSARPSSYHARHVTMPIFTWRERSAKATPFILRQQRALGDHELIAFIIARPSGLAFLSVEASCALLARAASFCASHAFMPRLRRPLRMPPSARRISQNSAHCAFHELSAFISAVLMSALPFLSSRASRLSSASPPPRHARSMSRIARFCGSIATSACRIRRFSSIRPCHEPTALTRLRLRSRKAACRIGPSISSTCAHLLKARTAGDDMRVRMALRRACFSLRSSAQSSHELYPLRASRFLSAESAFIITSHTAVASTHARKPADISRCTKCASARNIGSGSPNVLSAHVLKAAFLGPARMPPTPRSRSIRNSSRCSVYSTHALKPRLRPPLRSPKAARAITSRRSRYSSHMRSPLERPP